MPRVLTEDLRHHHLLPANWIDDFEAGELREVIVCILFHDRFKRFSVGQIDSRPTHVEYLQP